MCEIFIIEPADNEAELIEHNAADMFETNPDGIGLVAVYRDEETGRFEYEKYKNPEYVADEVMEFIKEHMDAWRMVVHARLATHGDTDYAQTHPIESECDQCEVDMVVHNGVVSAEDSWRTTLRGEDHEFNTEVDSEVILHEHSDLPTDIDDVEKPELSGSLNYILFQDEAILLRSGYRYRDTDEFKMGKKKRCEWEDSSKSSKFILATPDGEVESRKISRSSVNSGYAGSGGWAGQAGGGVRSGRRSSSYGSSGSGSSKSGSSSSRSRSGASSGTQKSYGQWEDWPPELPEAQQEGS